MIEQGGRCGGIVDPQSARGEQFRLLPKRDPRLSIPANAPCAVAPIARHDHETIVLSAELKEENTRP